MDVQVATKTDYEKYFSFFVFFLYNNVNNINRAFKNDGQNTDWNIVKDKLFHYQHPTN